MTSARNWPRVWRMTLAILLFNSGVLGAVAAVEPAQCAGSGIAVPQWNAAERERICAAAGTALRFLRGVGIRHEDGLTIRPLADAPEPYRGCEIGHFNVARNEIQVLPLAAAAGVQRLASAFNVPMSPALWSSYVSHEVAHAVIERHFAPAVRRFTASEYVAAVVQMHAMEPELRDTILHGFSNLDAYTSTEAIASLYYLMAPGQFAIKVYLHYINLGEAGPEFLHWLLRNGLQR